MFQRVLENVSRPINTEVDSSFYFSLTQRCSYSNVCFLSQGDCVYFKSCPPLLEIFNRRPPTTQDRLFLSLSQCGYRDGQPLVCCRDAAPVQPPPTPAPTASPVVPQQPSLLPRPGECGIDAENRIYGGNRTSIDEYPWMVLLEYSKCESADKSSQNQITQLKSFSPQQTTEKVSIVEAS